MQDQEKTKEQLIDELNEMRRRVAEINHVEEELQSKTHQLGERVKELNCLYTISRLVEKSDTSLDQILQGVINVIPPSWQYPEITCATIILQDREFKTENYKAPVSKQSADIVVHGERIGVLEVGYLDEEPESDEGPFVKEERNLINAVAERLGRIIEHKMAEDAIQENQELFSSILSTSPVGIGMSQDRVMKWVNESWVKMFGFQDKQECIGLDTRMIYLSDEEFWNAGKGLYASLETGNVTETDTKFRRKDGSVFDAHVRMKLVDTSGPERVTVAAITDISDRKRAEQEARKFKTMIDQANYGCAIIDLQGFIAYVNEAFADMHGFSPDELIGKNVSVFHTDEQMEEVNRLLEKLNQDGAFKSQEVWHVKKSGTVFPTLMNAVVIGHDEGTPLFLSATAIDITDSKRAEQERENLRNQLLQSQKMETMGTLAMGIAHDFNNMLTVILGYSSLLLADKNEGDQGYEELQKIVKTSQVAADLVQKIRLYGRLAEINRVPLDLNDQVDEVTQLLSHSLSKKIEMDIHLAKDPVIINADSSQIAQMVMNLAINASEAMRDGGTLAIQTENILLDDDFCQSHIGLKPGSHVILTVSDTGFGIDKRLMERIFDPFFTTKGRDYRKGTGLGLSVVQGIVQQHGGCITVESEVGQGTRFRIYLPVVDLEKVPEDVENGLPLPSGGKETILLVEDEEMVRDLGVAILEKIGYTVLNAVNGQDALEIYDKEQENISLVILDVIMPRMDGKQCFRELLRINPTVKVLVSSGVANDTLIEDVVELGAKASLTKPYAMRQLLQAVREILDTD